MSDLLLNQLLLTTKDLLSATKDLLSTTNDLLVVMIIIAFCLMFAMGVLSGIKLASLL